ncbi:TfuA-like protein [Streptomyces sp. NPDC048606]|uniref:TfuA-like protein n=1 Tax=Streptomyces sp. NPDC048606 TaxID=3154726 RepID=UPI0034463894
MTVHVFAGPTLGAAEILGEIDDCIVHPPIRHGDLFCLGVRPQDFVLIIDGLYHGHEPVRHKEILDVMNSGTVVIGAASMGALRAAELHSCGMRGVGRVYAMYRTGEIDADDEVAVAHGERPDGSAFSEALVDMRHALRLAGAEGVIDAAQAEALLEVARTLPYLRRSWRAVTRELGPRGEVFPPDAVLAAAAERVGRLAGARPEEVSLKRRDAREALRHVRALYASHPRPAAVAGTWTDGWETAWLHRWRGRFTGERTAAGFVSLAARFDYQRLFGADQRARRRTQVLAAVSGRPPGTPARVLEDEALRAAAREGLDAGSLSDEAIHAWVPEREREELGEREAMLTLLVRSARLTADLRDPATVRLLLPESAVHHTEISASLAMNQAVARSGYSRNPDQLKKSVLRLQLAQAWQLRGDCSTEVLDAAARDRGFTSAHEAEEALRPFFLRRHRETGEDRATPESTERPRMREHAELRERREAGGARTARRGEPARKGEAS